MLGPVFHFYPFNEEKEKLEVVVPETLDWCRKHYTPPVEEHIHCPDFGKSDGTNGGCWWCMEMTPYQWYMCSDETWVRGLLSPTARVKYKTREEAAAFIEDSKQKNPMKNPFGTVEETTAVRELHVGSRHFCSNCGKLAVMENYCSKCGAKVIE